MIRAKFEYSSMILQCDISVPKVLEELVRERISERVVEQNVDVPESSDDQVDCE